MCECGFLGFPIGINGSESVSACTTGNGCGTGVLAAAFPGMGIGLLGVSLAFGLTVVTGAYAFGPISGGHFNPALFAQTGAMGAIVGAVIYNTLLSDD